MGSTSRSARQFNVVIRHTRKSNPQTIKHRCSLDIEWWSHINIVILVNSLEKGGRTKRIIEEYRGLKELGHSVQLVAFLVPPTWVSKHSGINEELKVVEKSRLTFDFILIFRLIRLLVASRTDIIHAHCESSSFYGGLVSKVLFIPSIGTIHRSQLRYYKSAWKNRIYYNFLNRFIAVSEERKNRLVKDLGLNKLKVWVLHWGIEREEMLPQSKLSILEQKLDVAGEHALFSSGHLGQIKGHDDTIMAVALLKSKYPDIKLYIAGDGEASDHERLHSLIESCNLQGSVILLGQIANVLDWMWVCRAFVQPSREEAFGLVFLESGMCAKPTVSTQIGGIPEIISNGDTGFLVDTHNPKAIAEKLSLLLDSPELVRQMGLAARERILANFNLADKVKNLEIMFESLLKKN